MLFRIFQMEAAPRDKFIIIIAYVAALLIGLILHELAHGYVAKWNGDDTAHMAGRLSFNPLKHLDPIGTLCMLLIGFGWAKPVPINTRNFRNFRRGFFTVAIAGITVNLIIALIFTGAFHAVMTFGAGGISQNTPEIILVLLQLALYFSFYSVYINLTLMVFNLIPIYPLDGFRVVEALGEGKSRAIDRYVDFVRRNGSWLALVVILILNFTDALPKVIDALAGLLGVR